MRWTADGVPVLVHDAKTSSPMNCGRSYEIAKTTYATLQRKCRSTRDGRSHGLPTFAEAAKQIAAVPGGRLFVEVKTVQSPAQVAAFHQTLVDNNLLDRAVVTSFLPAELPRFAGSTARPAAGCGSCSSCRTRR